MKIMMKVISIALNTSREALRSKILYSAFFFFALLIGSSAFFGAVTIGDQVKVIKDFGLVTISLFGAVLTTIIGVSLLNRELKQKTIYNILSKPVARWQFILGKYLGVTTTVALLVFLMGLGLGLFVALFNNGLDIALLQGLVFILLEVVIVAAVSIFFSAMAVTTTLSGLFTLAVYIAGHSIGYFRYFLEEDGSFSPPLVFAVRIADAVLPDLQSLNFTSTLVYGNAVSTTVMLHGLVYSLSYATAVLLLAIAIFSKREFN